MNIFLKSVVIMVLCLSVNSVIAVTPYPDDSDVYNRLTTIKGKVQFLDHSQGGKILAGGQYLVFQRVGCADCLIATRTDENGDYKIRVGRGRYKIIVHNPSSKSYDLLAPGQARFVTAKSSVQDTEFDINLIAHNDKE